MPILILVLILLFVPGKYAYNSGWPEGAFRKVMIGCAIMVVISVIWLALLQN